MSDPGLRFVIRLDPETAHLDGPLRREIERRWPTRRVPHKCVKVSTLDLQHAEEGFRLEVVGWPAHRDNIRAFLMGLVAEGGWLEP